MSPSRRAVVDGNLSSTVSMLLWATAFPATELLLRSWDPLLLAAGRLSVAALAGFIVLSIIGRPGELRLAPWRTVLPLGGIGLGVGVTCLVIGQDLAEPVIVAIIATLVPVFSAVMGVVAGEERVDARLAVAILLAVTGGCIAAGVFDGVRSWRGGELFALVSILLWTWYSRASVGRLGMLSDLAKSTANLIAASIVLLPVAALAALLGWVPARLDLSGFSILQMLWLGSVSVCFSMLFWLRAARLIGVTIAAMHQNLVPFYVMAMALALGGEVGTAQITGAVLVVAGAALAQLPQATVQRVAASLRPRPRT